MNLLFRSVLPPNFIMPYGINKGYSLQEIYRFAPEYLEWLIKNIEAFEIELADFENLPKSLFCLNRTSKSSIRENMSVNFVKKIDEFEDYDFSFSLETRFILSQKKLGIFKPTETGTPFFHIHFSCSVPLLTDLYQYELKFE